MDKLIPPIIKRLTFHHNLLNTFVLYNGVIVEEGHYSIGELQGEFIPGELQGEFIPGELQGEFISGELRGEFIPGESSGIKSVLLGNHLYHLNGHRKKSKRIRR